MAMETLLGPKRSVSKDENVQELAAPLRMKIRRRTEGDIYNCIVMIQPDILYRLKVSKKHSVYELLALSANDSRTVLGPWQFESVEDMTSILFHLEMSAVDYIGFDQWLSGASSVEVGHPIKGSVLLEALSAAPPTRS